MAFGFLARDEARLLVGQRHLWLLRPAMIWKMLTSDTYRLISLAGAALFIIGRLAGIEGVVFHWFGAVVLVNTVVASWALMKDRFARS